MVRRRGGRSRRAVCGRCVSGRRRGSRRCGCTISCWRISGRRRRSRARWRAISCRNVSSRKLRRCRCWCTVCSRSISSGRRGSGRCRLSVHYGCVCRTWRGRRRRRRRSVLIRCGGIHHLSRFWAGRQHTGRTSRRRHHGWSVHCRGRCKARRRSRSRGLIRLLVCGSRIHAVRAGGLRQVLWLSSGRSDRSGRVGYSWWKGANFRQRRPSKAHQC